MNTYDIVIIGSGPAGMSAAIYAARAGMKCALVERMMPGGQMGETSKIDNYPGFAGGVDGFELAQSMSAQVDSFDIERISDEIEGIDLEGENKVVRGKSASYTARAVILAMGGHPRPLGLANEAALRGSGVSYCATCDGNFFRDKVAVVVGGGNTAAADALYLANICSKVIVVYRRDTLRAAQIYHQPIQDSAVIEVEWNSVVDGISEEDGHVTGVVVRNVETEVTKELSTDAVFVAIGTIPNTECVKGVVDIDASGYVVADESCTTNVPGIFAAGDIRTKALRQVVTAVADGAVAAEAAALYVSS